MGVRRRRVHALDVKTRMSDELAHSLASLLDLSRRARAARSADEIAFLLVNDSHGLASYRQAALWMRDEGVRALSGVIQPEANAPYVLWLEGVCRYLLDDDGQGVRTFDLADLPPSLAEEWGEWWPAHGLFLPLIGPEGTAEGGLLFVREEAWSEQEQALLTEWSDSGWHAFRHLHRPHPASWRALLARLRAHFALRAGLVWWKQPRWRWMAVVLALLLCPVRLTVLAPGELVPAHPVILRAPLDGVVDVFHVQPNQVVKKGQPLFGFDEAVIQSRLDVAAQALATTETEYRQTSQQALSDPKSKPQLAVLSGKIEEKRAEVDFLREQLNRARVLAPQDGVVLFDDPSEWIGKPVSVGERIMRIAALDDSEVEAWLPIADGIVLEDGASVSLYLNASPLSPVSAKLRYVAHEAQPRPDGTYAYRVRASLEAPTGHRVGLKGTAKLHGSWVPAAYWVMRRPLATLRGALGI